MKKIALLFALIVVNSVVWSAICVAQHDTYARVVFLDVGQGDAIFIEAPNGNQLLIDGGKNQSVLSELRSVMPWWDRRINVVLATHPDADHVGGLSFVIDRYKTDVLIESGNETQTSFYKALTASALSRSVARVEARVGQVIWLDHDMYFVVLFPEVDPRDMDPNVASIVGKLVYGESSVMLTGDSPIVIEEYLVSRYGDKLQSDILKAGHHGSRTSTSMMFVSAVSPREVVISAGKDNQYGHPHKEVVENVSLIGAELRNTGEEGRIEYVLYPDGRVEKKVE